MKKKMYSFRFDVEVMEKISILAGKANRKVTNFIEDHFKKITKNVKVKKKGRGID